MIMALVASLFLSALSAAAPIVNADSDLSVGKLATLPVRPVAGENFSIQFEIRNDGPDPYDGMVKTTLLIDGLEAYSRVEQYVISVGEARTISSSKSISLSAPGEHRITLQVEFGPASASMETIVMVTGGNTKVLQGQNVGKGGSSLTTLLALVALAALVVLFIVLWAVKKRRPAPEPAKGPQFVIALPPLPSGASELDELKRKKQEIEEMIRIAKVKYFKRKLDEDSYKALVSDNQKKLIEVEARIDELEKRVEKLESKE